MDKSKLIALIVALLAIIGVAVYFGKDHVTN
jgi:hypothetical protein